MNKYQCQVCGAVSYSAASQENLKDNSCLECDGRVEMVEGDKMNADEVVRALKSNAEVNHHAAVMMMAADLIETLQAQLAAKDAEIERLSQRTMTNAQSIRSMSDEELARWLVDATVCERVCDEDEYCHGNECVKRVTDWLQQKEEA